jgi:hypothetical protein
MAKIKALPSSATIDGLRGALDFYEWLGIPTVRKWPRSKLGERSTAVQAQNAIFAYVNHTSLTLSPQVIASWHWLASQSNLTWRDWLNRAYLGGTLTAPGMPPL